MNAPRHRTSSFGGLGVVSILFLAAVSHYEIKIVRRLDPDWLDRRAFWRAPLVEPEGDAIAPAPLESAFEKEREAPDPNRVWVDDFARVTNRCTPEAGGEVRDAGNGAAFVFPPGALRDAEDVSLAMIRAVPPAMERPAAGPAYELKIGAHPHYAFAKPVRVEIPYVKGLVKNDAVVLSVWENGRWKDLPSRVDRERGVVSAETRHASFFGVGVAGGAVTIAASPLSVGVLGGLAGLWRAAESPTLRGAAMAAWYGGSREYETPEGNFKIHYYLSGPAAIPGDAEMMPGGPHTGIAPIYVRDIGHALEVVRAHLYDERYDLPPARLIRYDVFLLPLGENGEDFGESGVGGPLYLSSRLLQISRHHTVNCEVGELIRHIVAHELHHVAQGQYYSRSGQAPQLWSGLGNFVEAVTEFEAWRYAEKHGYRFPAHDNYYINRNLSFPSVALTRASETTPYAYSAFFKWLHQARGEDATLKFIRAIYTRRMFSIAAMDEEARACFGGDSLMDLFTAFALDFYHSDMWACRLLKPPGRGWNSHVAADNKRSLALKIDARGNVKDAMKLVQRTEGSVFKMSWARFVEDPRPDCLIHPMTAHAISFICDPLLPAKQAARKQRGKLVLDVEVPRPGRELRAYAIAGRAESAYGKLPLAGTPGVLEQLNYKDGRFSLVIEDVGSKGGPNVVTLVLVNGLEGAVIDKLTLSRWLLAPPTTVELYRPEKNPYQGKSSIRWPTVDLAKHPEVFAGYRIYRKSVDDPLLPGQLVHTIGPQEGANLSILWEIPKQMDDPRSVFEVVTVDKHGNESFPRAALDRDPFVGVWEGSFRLADGSVVDAIAQGFKNAERLPDGSIPADVAREIDRVAALARPFEFLARAGVDAEFEIARVGSAYSMRITRIRNYVPTYEPDDALPMFARIAPDKLKLINAPRDWPIFELRLHRMDESGEKPNVIRETGFVAKDFVEGVKSSCTLAWTFSRVSPEEEK